jgi:hypothetical protein
MTLQVPNTNPMTLAHPLAILVPCQQTIIPYRPTALHTAPGMYVFRLFPAMNVMIDVILFAQPPWSQKPSVQPAWNGNVNGNGNSTNGVTLVHAATVPLPPSEYFKSPRLSALGTENGESKLRHSQKAPSEHDGLNVSTYKSIHSSLTEHHIFPSLPKSPHINTQNGNADRDKGKSPVDRTLSPRSQMTSRTRDGTVYPPLPESRAGDDDQVPMSPPKSVIAQSESLSQPRGSRKNVVNDAELSPRSGSRQGIYNNILSEFTLLYHSV